MIPQRIQLRRTRGYRKPEGAVVVARPSEWGNPFRAGETVPRDNPLWPYAVRALYGVGSEPPWLRGLVDIRLHLAQTAVDAYRWWLYEQPGLVLFLPELAGKDLCCWCGLLDPCHGDVLLAAANGGDW